MKKFKLKIQHNVPVPVKPDTVAGLIRWTLSKMKVGDSFVCPQEHIQPAYAIVKKTGIKIMARTITPELHTWENGYKLRVWRIK